MAFFVRRCAVNIKNVNKYNKFCALVQNEANEIQTKGRLLENRQISQQVSYRTFHTSNACNKIVAFHLSDIGEGIREVVIKEWFVKVGDRVAQFDNICEVQSDKAAVTITSRYDGVITKLYHQVDQTAFVGKPLIDIETVDAEEDELSAENSGTIKVKEEVTNDTNKNNSHKIKVLTTPSVRRIASQFSVDLSHVKASGKNGRIMKEDILSYLNITAEKSNEVPDQTYVETKSVPFTQAQARTEILMEDRTVPVSGFTKAMVKSMTESMKIPHFVYSDEYDVSNLVEARAKLKEIAEKQKIKLTYMPIIVKAASLSLTVYPIVNSSLDANCENIIYKAIHNIGVAMDTPNGLVVPVIKNVQNKSILEIASELTNLQEKGSQGQLGLSDISGGTFTISNIGIIGGTYTKPVILSPQVSIGALGRIQVLPRFDKDGNVVKAHILTTSWAADHRVIDGVTMAKFSNQIKQYLENPYTLLLDL